MFEINITKLFTETTAKDYSASVAEIGANAGALTWRFAVSDSRYYTHVTRKNKNQFIDHFVGFGAWSESELKAMPIVELNALFIQLVSGDIREAGLDQASPDWVQYARDSEAGKVAGNLFGGTDDQVYYSLNN